MKIFCTSIITICLAGLALSLSGQDRVSRHFVIAQKSDACEALFSFAPDSFTSHPFYYHFTDLSTGNTNTWHWDFGDGSSSTEKSPSHQYAEGGTYTVCLKVSNDSDTANCNDLLCKEISTLDYFSLGGLVYAGEYPINNPENAGDTGVASLYRIINSQIVFVEDHLFNEYGYYWFGYLFPGQYMIKIGLTEGSANFNKYFTTYFGDQISWTKADILDISDANLYAEDIHLEPVRVMQNGPGIIRGYVKFEQGDLYTLPPVSQTTVILADNDQRPLIFTRPNAAGYFEFKNIPYDSYFLTADATGKPASTVMVILSQSTPVAEGINLTVFGSNTNFIAEREEQGFFISRIYPNPVDENLCLTVHSGSKTAASIGITDISGKIHRELTVRFETGTNQITIPVNSLPKGIYFLSMQPQGIYLPVTVKFIK